MHTSTTPRRRRLVGTLAVVAGATALALAVPGTATAAPVPTAAAPTHHRPGPTPALDPTQFHGVNWADPRDNYVNGPVVPSGLSTSDDYRTVYKTSERIVREFRKDLGADTVRLPVNPYSVGTAWWTSYKGAIDAARHQGVVDDPAAWTAMWDTLTSTYRGDAGVYFEPMNEPFGYAPADWIQVATDCSSAAPATTTTSTRSAPRRHSPGPTCRSTSTGSGARTTTRAGPPTSRADSATRRAAPAPSSTSSGSR
ncbi:hypothetical protein [Curtobacterium sp. Csp1]|uniref:hypothetical protein n=1 Tax=Curtobacterium sp. Csp1 TaxID=2495429 RepID=UPI001C2F03A2|nr:hypothetical protein [Curtobacterium sp. Csp1]